MTPSVSESAAPVGRRTIACLCAYDGTEYCGSQRQRNEPSVQGEIERALQAVLKQETPIVLAGRTDAGVHALGQCFRFETDNRIPVERVPLALNSSLKKSVRVLTAREVDDTFHPRYSARSRVYRYCIECAPVGNVLLRHSVAHSRSTLDVTAMRRAAQVLVGRRDFAAWQSSGSPTKSTVREIMRVNITEREVCFDSRLLEIEIEADAFLYQMVRNIVGALMQAGRGVLSPADIAALTAGRDRTLCPAPAPPQGLCLWEVKY